MDKFLLAENPMRPDQSGLFIIHMLDPIAIIQCREAHVSEKEGEILKYFYFKNIDGVTEEWTLSIFHFFTTDFLEQPEDRALKLLDRAWRWYRAYMEWEDNKIDSDEFGEQN
jgi:hypothetical protein